MKGRINNILKDLYRLDSGLANHEEELMRIIQMLLESKPETRFNEAWARELRAQLLARRPVEARTGFFGLIARTIHFMSLNYTYVGAVAVVALLVVAGAFAFRGGPGGSRLAFAPEITSVGKNAFGSLVSQDGKGLGVGERGAAEEASAPSAPTLAAGIGFGGGGAGGDSSAARSSQIVPPSYALTYRYAGDEFALSASEVEVLRRVRRGAATGSLVSSLSRFGAGLVNLGAFADTRMQNVTFVEDREFGYMVNISFEDGSISINENWARWNNLANACRDEACFQALRLSIDDIPADAELIRIADSFLAEYGIPTSSFGPAEVNNDWRRSYEATEDKSQYYVPEVVTVRYPLLVNGQAVYEQGGEPAGLNVNVNVRFNRVSGVWGLTTEQYEASNYAAVTDASRIIKFAEQGGLYGPIVYYAENGVVPASKEVVLGTPEFVLMRSWTYRDNVSNELLVPAVRFPVISEPDVPYFYQQAVVVPLAEELLAERETPGPIQIVPAEGEPALLKSE